KAGEHHEGVFFDRAARAGDRRPTNIDRLSFAVKDRIDSRGWIAQGQAEVSGEQVARSARDNRHRDAGAGHYFGHGPDRAVTPGDEYCTRPTLDSSPRSTLPGVTFGCGIEPGAQPASSLGLRDYERTQLFLVNLRGVVDQ